MISYAQNFEDVRLMRAFSDVTRGRYLDIGTQDPVCDSVSLAFYERGWRGVHVEPTPAYANAMRAARPDETVIEAAVSCAAGPIEFFEIPDTGLSTGITEIADRHAKGGHMHRAIKVPTVTLASLFSLMRTEDIHWLKIDVEGMEADVLASWGEHPARPAALVIEATLPNTQIASHAAWQDMVVSRGYQYILFDGLSRYFIHETHAERAAALALSPNVFDGFYVSSSHFTAGKVITEKNAEITKAHQQSKADLQDAISRIRAQLDAERTAKISALRKHAKTDKQAAITAARAEEKAVLKAVRAELETQLVAKDKGIAETREAILAQQQENLVLSREAGRLQGELATQAEACATRLRDAETIRLDLAQRLDRAERELAEARVAAADLRDQIQQNDAAHAVVVAKAEATLAAAEARAVQLAGDLAKTTQYLDESKAARTRAEEERDKARQRGEEEAVALRADVLQLQDQITWCERQLAEANQLLTTPSDPLQGWPHKVALALARLAGRKPQAILDANIARVNDWLAELKLPAGAEASSQYLSVNSSTSEVDLV